MTLDMDSFAEAIKVQYSDENVEYLGLSKMPFLAMVPKSEDFFGSPFHMAMHVGTSQGATPGFAEAKTAGALTAEVIKGFDVTRVNLHKTATVANEVIEASEGKQGTLMKAVKTAFDGAILNLKRGLALQAYRGGYGKIGTIVSNTGSTITVSVADSFNFESGQQVVFSESESGHVLRDSGDYLTVLSANRSSGVITFTGAVSGISAIANGDTIFQRYWREDSATPSRLVVTGMEGWIPSAGPTSTAFFGLDRTTAPVELAGSYFDGSSYNVEEALIKGVLQAASHGGQIDNVFLNPVQYNNLILGLSGRVQYIDHKVKANLSFPGVMMQTAAGPVNVHPDIHCPVNRAHAVQLDTWEWMSMGPLVKLNTTGDNLSWLRIDGSDGVEARFVSRSNLVCKDPRANATIILASS